MSIVQSLLIFSYYVDFYEEYYPLYGSTTVLAIAVVMGTVVYHLFLLLFKSIAFIFKNIFLKKKLKKLKYF